MGASLVIVVVIVFGGVFFFFSNKFTNLLSLSNYTNNNCIVVIDLY